MTGGSGGSSTDFGEGYTPFSKGGEAGGSGGSRPLSARHTFTEVMRNITAIMVITNFFIRATHLLLFSC